MFARQRLLGQAAHPRRAHLRMTHFFTRGRAAGPTLNMSHTTRLGLVGLKVGIEQSDLVAHPGDVLVVMVIEGNQLMDEALGMDPAQAVELDIALPRIVADDGQFRRRAFAPGY